MEIKAIIFDWGRTLFDVDTGKLTDDAEDVLSYCKSKGYKICVASLVRANTTIEERENQIKILPSSKYVDMFEVSDEKEKDKILEKLLKKLNFPKEKVLFVDDRIVKSIKYGNKNGYPTIWLKNGPFANELPNSETGMPTFTIKTLSELKNLI